MSAMQGRQAKELARLWSSSRKLESWRSGGSGSQRDWSENETGKAPRPCDLTQRQPINRDSTRPTILVSRITFSAVYSAPSILISSLPRPCGCMMDIGGGPGVHRHESLRKRLKRCKRSAGVQAEAVKLPSSWGQNFRGPSSASPATWGRPLKIPLLADIDPA